MEGIEEIEEKLEAAVMMVAVAEAARIESKMKQDRVWTDRTGHAKQRLTARASSIDGGVRITLAHGVDYGVWLELAHAGKYAIITPTVRRNAPQTMKAFRNLFAKIKAV